MEKIDRSKLPLHIGIILDGNGRWAQKRNLPRLDGHRQGAKTAQKIIEFSSTLGIKVLSLFIFSTENWNRPKLEVQGLMKIFRQALRDGLEKMMEKKIKLRVSGEKERLPASLQQLIEKNIQTTANNSGMILNLALNYGGRAEIVFATRQLAKLVKENKIDLVNINENTFSKFLWTQGLPDPDLIIRTSGEYRISNFFLWQSAYTELYFTSVLWPDFKKEDLVKAIINFQKRKRRFGQVE